MKDLSYSLKGFLFFSFLFFPTTTSKKGPKFDDLLSFFFFFNFRTYKDILISFEGGGTSVHRIKIKIAINYSAK